MPATPRSYPHSSRRRCSGWCSASWGFTCLVGCPSLTSTLADTTTPSEFLANRPGSSGLPPGLSRLLHNRCQPSASLLPTFKLSLPPMCPANTWATQPAVVPERSPPNLLIFCSFDTFLNAMVSTFNILNLENWNQQMYPLIRETNWGTSAYFVLWIIIGGWVPVDYHWWVGAWVARLAPGIREPSCHVAQPRGVAATRCGTVPRHTAPNCTALPRRQVHLPVAVPGRHAGGI